MRLPDQMPTQRAISNPKATRVVVGLFVLLIASFALILLGRPSGASAAEVSCPNSNPIVNENNCMGEGTTANQSAIENYSEDLGAFTTQTSYNLGENVPIKIGTDLPSFPATNVNIDDLPDRLVRRRRRASDRRRGREQRQSQQLLPVQPGEHHHGRTELLQLERQLHGPRQQAADLGHLRGRDHRRRRQRDRELRRLPGAQRRAPLAGPLRAAERRLRGLQHVGLQVPLLRRLRRRQHDRRRRAGGCGLLRSSREGRRTAVQPLLRARLPDRGLAGAAGLRSRLHVRRGPRLQRQPAAQPQGRPHLRPLRVLVLQRVQQLQGRARTPA